MSNQETKQRLLEARALRIKAEPYTAYDDVPAMVKAKLDARIKLVEGLLERQLVPDEVDKYKSFALLTCQFTAGIAAGHERHKPAYEQALGMLTEFEGTLEIMSIRQFGGHLAQEVRSALNIPEV